MYYRPVRISRTQLDDGSTAIIKTRETDTGYWYTTIERVDGPGLHPELAYARESDTQPEALSFHRYFAARIEAGWNPRAY